MAIMIPEYAVHASKAAETLYKNLSRVLGSGYRVVQYLQDLKPAQERLLASISDLENQQDSHLNGSLFWIQKSRQSLFVYISHVDANDIGIDKKQPDKLLLNLNENSEIRTILRFQKSLLPEPLLAHKARLIPFLIFYSHVDDNKIKFGIKSHGLHLAGKQSLQTRPLLHLLRTCMGAESTPFVINHIRKIFSPELKLRSETHDKLLDEYQEIALKTDIYLPIEARRSENYNLCITNGVAGSGKTQVLIHRAHLLRTLFPTQKILILCHNPAIKHAIETQYQAINPGDRKIRIYAFLDWCRKNISIKQKLVYESDINDAISTAYQRHLVNTDLTTDDLLRELNYVRGRLIFSEADYIASKPRLDTPDNHRDNKERLQKLWKAMLTLQNQLQANGQTLWCDLPKQLLEQSNEGKLLEHFDHILVDEAQYFAPLYYALIKKSLTPHSGQLYLTYDENQGFLKSRIHLQDTGLDLRGHSMHLLSSYRLNPAIMKAAHAVHLNQLPNHSDDIFSNSGHGNSTEIKPRLLHFQDKQAEQTRLLKEIHDLLNPENTPVITEKDILVLTSKASDAHPLASTIRQTLKLAVDIPTLAHNDPNALHVCPLESATGLESRIVFITGIEAILTTETAAQQHPSSIEPESSHIENTRKLYMGMTRATTQLYLMLTAKTIPPALKTHYIALSDAGNDQAQNEENQVYYL